MDLGKLKIELPWWMGEGELEKVRAGSQKFWEKVTTWVKWPVSQLDPQTCSYGMLELLAYSRDIERFKNEPEPLFRKRVDYAFKNAIDAGSKRGFFRIFTRLGVDVVEILERQPGKDWDVVTLHLAETDFAEIEGLLGTLTRQYGMTCRRYEFATFQQADNQVGAAEFNNETMYLEASANIAYTVTNSADSQTGSTEFNLDAMSVEAVAII